VLVNFVANVLNATTASISNITNNNNINNIQTLRARAFFVLFYFISSKICVIVAVVEKSELFSFLNFFYILTANYAVYLLSSNSEKRRIFFK